jgi:aryl-alcohol dehydrogenase-like predicted oxidoreductase
MIPQCIDQGVGVLPWSPLARGCSPATARARASADDARADRPFGDSLYTPDVDFAVVDRAARSPRARRPTAQVALAWLCTSPASRRRSSARRRSSTSRTRSPRSSSR